MPKKTERQKLVTVALPLPLRRNFTYELPPALDKAITGARVIVPFGNRKLIGYVVGESSGEFQKIKEVISLLDEEPFFSKELFEFLARLADYYLAPLGLILKNSYPSCLDPVQRTTYGIAQGKDYSGGDKNLSDLAAELGFGKKTYAALKSKFKSSLDKTLAVALSAGIIESEGHFTEIRRRAQNDRIAMILNGDAIDKKIEELDLPKAHRKALEAVRQSETTGFPTVKEIAIQAKVPHYVVQELEKLGFIEMFGIFPVKLPSKPSKLVLTSRQKKVYDDISAAITEEKHKTFLLYGITGSGKTEVYLRLFEDVLKRGGNGIYMVPEISLAGYLSRRLLERFGSRVAILHSGLGEKERGRQWLRMRKGEARIAIGPRSVLFSPLEKIKLVVVDEEHDSSYRQTDHPFYNARDMAIFRASLMGAVVVLGSATPSIESYFNALEEKKYALETLSERVTGAALAEARIVDMKKTYSETKEKLLISPALESEIEKSLAKKEQIVILRNRLGFSTFVVCRECGRTIKCQNCDVGLTYHKKKNRLKCHICGKVYPIFKKCPYCKGEALHFLGEGTEKVEDYLSLRFPSAKIGRMDRDAVVNAAQYDRLWSDFEEGAIDILVGTQMISKGYHNPMVTLVGIISADFILGIPDYRSAERAFELITQAAGRSGRGSLKGKVVIQSYFPGHYAVVSASRQDFPSFYEQEIKYRKALGYPPVTALGRIEIRDKNEKKAIEIANNCYAALKAIGGENCRILGPNSAPIAKIEKSWRYHILVKTKTRMRLNDIFNKLMKTELQKQIGKSIFLDVDPASLM